MKKLVMGLMAAVALMMLVDSAMAQGRGRGFGGGIGNTDPLSLARNANVRKEVEIEEDQLAEINKIQEAMNDELRTVQSQVRAKYTKKLDDVLLPHQAKRLQEISIQLQGIGALNNAEVAKKLGISEAQQKKMADIRTQYRDKTRELFQGGFNREAFEKMRELREEGDKAVLGVLSSSQQSAFEQLKGKPIDREQLFPPRRRGGGGGNRPERKRPKT